MACPPNIRIRIPINPLNPEADNSKKQRNYKAEEGTTKMTTFIIAIGTWYIITIFTMLLHSQSVYKNEYTLLLRFFFRSDICSIIYLNLFKITI